MSLLACVYLVKCVLVLCFEFVRLLITSCVINHLHVRMRRLHFLFEYVEDFGQCPGCVFKDVKCSGNWMWAAKLPGEGACLWDACKALCEVMGQLGVAIDGGKDSLSMAARVGNETVKAPGSLFLFVS